VKFIMVDPKRLELGLYADIPHLATPIITDPKRAAVSLKWAVLEMERRYKGPCRLWRPQHRRLQRRGETRNDLEMWDDNGEAHRTLPYIVIIIDELAGPDDGGGQRCRRLDHAAGANGTCRRHSSCACDAAAIGGCHYRLDQGEFPCSHFVPRIEQGRFANYHRRQWCRMLLGKGDMLFLPPASSQVIRVHGAYVDEKEIGRIVEQ
jgi:S-DNA-T family DNA segregation ATPase FtsK/SpoIIIE